MLSSDFWCAAETHLDSMNLQEVAIKLMLVKENCCSSECFPAEEEQAPCPHDCQCHVHKQQGKATVFFSIFIMRDRTWWSMSRSVAATSNFLLQVPGVIRSDDDGWTDDRLTYLLHKTTHSKPSENLRTIIHPSSLRPSSSPSNRMLVLEGRTARSKIDHVFSVKRLLLLLALLATDSLISS